MHQTGKLANLLLTNVYERLVELLPQKDEKRESGQQSNELQNQAERKKPKRSDGTLSEMYLDKVV